MRPFRCFVAALWLVGLLKTAACAHFNMLFPDRASAKKGEEVILTYQWGHPFEHQLFDAPAPESLIVLAPDGKQTDLSKSLEKITLSEGGKKVTAYRLHFTPPERGDYVFILKTPPIWMGEEQEYLQDTVKVVLHVQAQNGWDNCVRQLGLYDVKPLTRPYGLQPGMTVQFLYGHHFDSLMKPLPDALVEIERYNPTPPKTLPPDEQVTRTAKTDPNGVVTSTLPEAGWWCLAATRDAGEKEHEGNAYPVRQRLIHWVAVDEKVVPVKEP
jgi:uncharacterized GH25 family protein